MTPSGPTGGSRPKQRTTRLVITVVAAGALLTACSGEGITSQPLPLAAPTTTLRATTTTGATAGPTTRRSARALAPFQGDGFTVLMPGTPKRSEQTAQSAAGTVTVVLYTSDNRDSAYLVGYTDLPAGATIDLPGAIEGAAAGVKGTVNEERDTTHQGFPARDARITNADGGNGIKGTAFLRVIDADDRLYQLQYIEAGADVKTPSADYPEFLASLKIG